MSEIEVEKVITDLAAWSQRLHEQDRCERAFVFGSLVNRDGRHFLISGATTSDIDILLEFNKKSADAILRTADCIEIQKTIAQAEYNVGKNLVAMEKQGLLSVLLVTQYEIYHCIHKGFDPKIYTHNLFLPLIGENKSRVRLADYIDAKCHLENIELFAIARIAQKIRNNYLKTNLYGNHVVKLEDDPYDSLPKEILRAGALLRYVEEIRRTNKENSELRTDLEEGENYIFSKISSLATANYAYKEILDKLSARRNKRATSPKLDPTDVLFVSEILFDIMRSLARITVREVIDGIIQDKKI